MTAEQAGQRLDRVLATVAGVSRSMARQWVERGMVSIEGTIASPSTRLEVGATFEYSLPDEGESIVPDPSVEFGLLYEEDSFAVVDKPPGLVVHPAPGPPVATLAAGALARWPQIRGVGEAFRWGIVHRLDKETSGALLIAKKQSAFEYFVGALKAREIGRSYRALAQGRFEMPSGTIDGPIGRNPSRPTEMVISVEGRAARTHYRVVEETPDQTLLELRLESGRTHQIRVHLAAIGHPVIGDEVYGGGRAERLWLHAARLEFRHPVDGRAMIIDSPPPPPLQ